MESNRKVLTLLSIVVLASGCINSGGGETVTEGPESVLVESLTVTPKEIYSDQPVRASITAVNAGNIEAKVDVGENGSELLGDYCTDLFKLEQFRASSSRTSQTEESYTLQSGEKINARWTLEQQGNVPIYGKRCNLAFSVPFNYSVESYRQIQIKQDRDVSGSPQLSSESTTGPMVLAIETLPGSTGQPNTFVLSENRDNRINVMIQLINPSPDDEEGFNKGLVDVDKRSFYVQASKPLQLDESYEDGAWTVNADYEDPRCDMPEADIRMTQGRSVTISCEIPIDSDIESPSVLSEITAGVGYQYIKNAGQRQVQVQPRG